MFVLQWAQFALSTRDADYIRTLAGGPYIDTLRRNSSSFVPLQLLVAADRKLEARDFAELLLSRRDIDSIYRAREGIPELVGTFAAIDMADEFIEMLDAYMPDDEIERLRRKYNVARRSRLEG